MELTVQFVQVLGLLVILAGATVVFVHVITWIAGKKHSQIRIGLELLILLTAVHLFGTLALDFLGLRNLEETVSRVVAFLWWISLAFLVDALVKRYLWFGLLAHRGESHVPKILRDGASLLVYATAVMVVMHFVYDEPITAVLATSGAAAFIVGFSAQSTLREVFAGLSLSSTKALKIGDYLEIDGIYGRVDEINWRSVSLHNPHTDSLYIFPNSAVADKVILNYCEPTERFKNTVNFVVEFSASPELVSRLVLQSLEHSQYVLRDPKPDINVMGFTDLGMEYRIRYFFDGDDPWWDAQAEVCNAIWGVLRQHGIRLGIDRHKLQSGDELADCPWSRDIPPPENEAPSLFAAAPVFRHLEGRVLTEIAAGAKRRDFTPPQCVYLEGDASDAVYVVADGRLNVIQSQPDGVEAIVGTLTKGAAFGFGGLLDGAPRETAVQATEYSVVYRIGVDALTDAIRSNPDFVEHVREHIVSTRREHAERLATHLDEHRHREHHRTRTDVIAALRSHVRDVFKPGLVTEMVRSLFTRHTEKTILNAVMAAAALISAARGEIDEIERDYVVETLDSLELLHHTDRETGLAAFNAIGAAITDDPERGSEHALSAIRRVADNDKIAHVVMGIAHGVTGLHGGVTDGERAALDKVADVLGMPPEAGGLVSSMAGLESK
jgi:small-conductance mechanosensitive channel/CRP-like cAMP-binding protein